MLWGINQEVFECQERIQSKLKSNFPILRKSFKKKCQPKFGFLWANLAFLFQVCYFDLVWQPSSINDDAQIKHCSHCTGHQDADFKLFVTFMLFCSKINIVTFHAFFGIRLCQVKSWPHKIFTFGKSVLHESTKLHSAHSQRDQFNDLKNCRPSGVRSHDSLPRWKVILAWIKRLYSEKHSGNL